MKIILDIKDNNDSEIIIKSNEKSKDVLDLYEYLNEYLKKCKIKLLKNNREHLLNVNEIYFFETEAKAIYAHTNDLYYECKYRLYELEDLLPDNFIRVSKSTIINISYIISLERSFSSSTLIKFENCTKEVFVSRRYYKNLKNKLERRTF